MVVVELQERKASFNRPVGFITEILGDNLAPGMEIEIALRNHDIPHVWPEGVENRFANLMKKYRKKLNSVEWIYVIYH
ncbi:ribonuclease R [Actinobacillus equuli]|nr:ribonuclease R [Actinobacillus equuli]